MTLGNTRRKAGKRYRKEECSSHYCYGTSDSLVVKNSTIIFSIQCCASGIWKELKFEMSSEPSGIGRLSRLHVPDGLLPCWQLMLKVCRELSWVDGPEHLHVGSPAEQPGYNQTSYLVTGFPQDWVSERIRWKLTACFSLALEIIWCQYCHTMFIKAIISPQGEWTLILSLNGRNAKDFGAFQKSLQEGSQ